MGADHTGVPEAGGYLLLPEALEVCLLLLGIVPGLQEGWNNNQFWGHIIMTLLKLKAAKTVWDTVKILYHA